jgi:hypothetical protein
MSPGTHEDDLGSEITVEAGTISASTGWTLMTNKENAINRIGPEVMLHLEFSHGAGASAVALQLPDQNYWPDHDVDTENGLFVVHGPAGVNAVHTYATSGVPTGGSFLVTYGGKAGITVLDASTAAQLQTLLDGIFGVGNTLVAGGPLPTALSVTFQGALAAEPVPLPAVVDSGLTGGSTPHATVTSATTGVFGGAITYTGDTSGSSAGPIVCEAVYDPMGRG